MKKLIILSAVGLFSATAHAQYVVYDPTVNIEQIISQAENIAKYVEMVDNQVQQIQQLTAQLQQLQQYNKAFGDPSTNPQGWPVRELGDALAEPPTLGTMAKPSREQGTWLDLRVANIQGGLLTVGDKRWLELPNDQIRRLALRDGDLVLARAIGSLDHLGKAVVVKTCGENCGATRSSGGI